DHSTPSHLAMRLAVTPPAALNAPATHSSGPLPLSIVSISVALSFRPAARSPHCSPSHCAMLLALTLAPASVKSPLTTSTPGVAGLPSASYTPMAVTFPLTPPPRAVQFWPSHLATLLAAPVPAVVNWPPAYRAGPVPSS